VVLLKAIVKGLEEAAGGDVFGESSAPGFGSPAIEPVENVAPGAWRVKEFGGGLFEPGSVGIAGDEPLKPDGGHVVRKGFEQGENMAADLAGNEERNSVGGRVGDLEIERDGSVGGDQDVIERGMFLDQARVASLFGDDVATMPFLEEYVENPLLVRFRNEGSASTAGRSRPSSHSMQR